MATASLDLDRAQLVRRGRRLEYATVLLACAEAAGALIAGVSASSVALVSFGVDSLIEVVSGAALLWRLSHDANPAHRASAERTTLRIVGACFVALAIYVASDALHALWSRETPQATPAGIAVTVLSFSAMVALARAKRTVASQLRSGAMAADAAQSSLCAYLSAITLGGLLLNVSLGWWWADPVAALAMTPIILKEGRQALSGKGCGCSNGACH